MGIPTRGTCVMLRAFAALVAVFCGGLATVAVFLPWYSITRFEPWWERWGDSRNGYGGRWPSYDYQHWWSGVRFGPAGEAVLLLSVVGAGLIACVCARNWTADRTNRRLAGWSAIAFLLALLLTGNDFLFRTPYVLVELTPAETAAALPRNLTVAPELLAEGWRGVRRKEIGIDLTLFACGVSTAGAAFTWWELRRRVRRIPHASPPSPSGPPLARGAPLEPPTAAP